MKYGALSPGEGLIDLTWSLPASGGPGFVDPDRRIVSS